MSTGTDLIEGALQEIGVISVAVPSSPEQITDGLRKLNSMVNLWLSWGIMMKWVPITVAGENLDEPIDATTAIIYNLAIKLAPTYSKPVSQDLKNNARIELEMVKSLYQDISIPDKVVSSTLPLGAGNSKGVDARVYHRQGGSISN